MGCAAVDVFVRRGKSYIPTLAKTDMGVYMTVAPVYMVDLDIDKLTETIEQMCKTGNPDIPHPTRDEAKHLPQPLLKAAKVNSWKKFAEGGTSYAISWRKEDIILGFYKLDEKGRFVNDMPKERHFPIRTDIRKIAQVILEDVFSHPELLI